MRDQYPKNIDLQDSNPKNTLLIPVCKYAKHSPPPPGTRDPIIVNRNQFDNY